MQKLTVSLVLIILFSCSGFSKEYSIKVYPEDNCVDTSSNEYYRILDGLKLKYVFYYKSENDSIFKHDSIEYWESYQRFFRLDRKFIDWLLTFRSDNIKSDLWQLNQDPESSYVSDCFLHWNNSRAAITLIQNFLDGYGFRCYECGYPYRQKCILEQYKNVEKFLKLNKSEDINELRQAWKMKNAR